MQSKHSSDSFESRFFHGKSDVTVVNYDNNHGGTRNNIHTGNIMQSFSADSSSGATQYHRLEVVLVQDDDDSYSWARVLFFSYVKSVDVTESRKVDICTIFRYKTTYGRDWQRATLHSPQIGNRKWIKLFYQFKFKPIWYMQDWRPVQGSFSTISVHHIVRDAHSVNPFFAKFQW